MLVCLHRKEKQRPTLTIQKVYIATHTNIYITICCNIIIAFIPDSGSTDFDDEYKDQV